MRVAVDVTAGVNQAAGIGRTTREVVTALAAADRAPALRLVYAAAGGAASAAGLAWLDDLRRAHPRTRARRLPLSPRAMTWLWARLRLPLPIELVTGPVEVVLGPDFVAPPAARARAVVIVHDLSFLTTPEHADPGLRRYLTRTVPPAARRAAHVAAVSEATRRDLIAHLALPPERVSVVHNGVDARFRPATAGEMAAARAALDLPARFILIVSTLEPRKNHVTLLRAFAPLAAADPDLGLIIAGRRGWLDDAIFAEIDRLGLGRRARWIGPAPDALLPALYSAATVFAFPSWYEGFGLPPLEAMACGTPVVASSVSSLPEVCGEAALLVEPGDTPALTAALRRLLDDAALRATLAARGQVQAARFTWAASARALIEVFHQVC